MPRWFTARIGEAASRRPPLRLTNRPYRPVAPHGLAEDTPATNQECEMRVRWPVVAVLMGLGAGYLLYPYATLYRLDTAVRQSDAATLRSLVDWYAVREGLKEDICDELLDEPETARPGNELAPFGAGFVRGMTGNAVDRTVTPEMLVSMTRPADDTRHAVVAVDAPVDGPVDAQLDAHVGAPMDGPMDGPVSEPVRAPGNVAGNVPRNVPRNAPGSASGNAHVEWAFFSGPTEFLVLVRSDAAAEPIRVEMALQGLRWKVRRIRLPLALLERAGSGT